MSESIETQETNQTSTEVPQTELADSGNDTESTEVVTTSEESSEAQTTEESNQETQSTTEVTESKPLAMQEKLSDEFRNFFEGKMTDKDYANIEKMGYTRGDFELIASAMKQQQDKNTQEVLESIGGPQVFGELQKFAEANLKQEERDVINNILKTDLNLAKLVLQGVKAQMDAANGYGPAIRINTQTSVTESDLFNSKRELVDALTSFKYKQDPSYRQDVDSFRKKKGW